MVAIFMHFAWFAGGAELTCRSEFAYMDEGKGRGRCRLPAFLRHKHILVQKQERKLYSDKNRGSGNLGGINSALQFRRHLLMKIPRLHLQPGEQIRMIFQALHYQVLDTICPLDLSPGAQQMGAQ